MSRLLATPTCLFYPACTLLGNPVLKFLLKQPYLRCTLRYTVQNLKTPDLTYFFSPFKKNIGAIYFISSLHLKCENTEKFKSVQKKRKRKKFVTNCKGKKKYKQEKKRKKTKSWLCTYCNRFKQLFDHKQLLRAYKKD